MRLARRIESSAEVVGIVRQQGDEAHRRSVVSRLYDGLLRLWHACPAEPNELPEEQAPSGNSRWDLLNIGATDLEGLRAYLAKCRPELIVDYGAENLAAVVCEGVPQGTLSVFAKPESADERLLLFVLRQKAGSPAEHMSCSAMLDRAPLDTAVSRALKLDFLACDLLAESIAELNRNTTGVDTPATGQDVIGKRLTAKDLDVTSLLKSATAIVAARGRPAWKLLARTLLFGPFLLVRNWYRRCRSSFPVVVLFHHLVSDRPHFLGMPTELFLRQVEYLRRHYRVITLHEAVRQLRGNCVPAPTVVLTFDDGYADNYLTLRAVATRTQLPMTLFVSTDYLGTDRDFEHDKAFDCHGFRPLTWDELAQMEAEGFEIGSHTKTHFDCGSEAKELLEDEIVGSAADLQERLGRAVRIFSFPFGHPSNMSSAAVAIADDTYDIVCSACEGTNPPRRDGMNRHICRSSQPADLWELELTLQQVLEMR